MEKFRIHRVKCDRCKAVKNIEIAENEYNQYRDYHKEWGEIHAQKITNELSKAAIIGDKYRLYLCPICRQDFEHFMAESTPQSIQRHVHVTANGAYTGIDIKSSSGELEWPTTWIGKYPTTKAKLRSD